MESERHSIVVPALCFHSLLLSFCFLMLFSVSSVANLQDGLINYWPLDGDVTDSIGKHDGEVIGGPAWVKARVGKGVEDDIRQSVA